MWKKRWQQICLWLFGFQPISRGIIPAHHVWHTQQNVSAKLSKKNAQKTLLFKAHATVSVPCFWIDTPPVKLGDRWKSDHFAVKKSVFQGEKDMQPFCLAPRHTGIEAWLKKHSADPAVFIEWGANYWYGWRWEKQQLIAVEMLHKTTSLRLKQAAFHRLRSRQQKVFFLDAIDESCTVDEAVVVPKKQIQRLTSWYFCLLVPSTWKGIGALVQSQLWYLTRTGTFVLTLSTVLQLFFNPQLPVKVFDSSYKEHTDPFWSLYDTILREKMTGLHTIQYEAGRKTLYQTVHHTTPVEYNKEKRDEA